MKKSRLIISLLVVWALLAQGPLARPAAIVARPRPDRPGSTDWPRILLPICQAVRARGQYQRRKNSQEPVAGNVKEALSGRIGPRPGNALWS